MSKNAAGALALILLWIAFAAFFVAFHPGGLHSDTFVTKNNPHGEARNPRDALIWFMQRVASGNPASSEQPI